MERSDNALTTSRTHPESATPPRRLAELCQVNGYLAQYRGTSHPIDRPAIVHHYAVSNLPMDEYLIGLLGHVAQGQGPGGWSGHVTAGQFVPTYVKTDDWETTAIEREIPKPRDGKAYTWRWVGRDKTLWKYDGWEKVPFPVCDCCDKEHRPGRCSRHDRDVKAFGPCPGGCSYGCPAEEVTP